MTKFTPRIRRTAGAALLVTGLLAFTSPAVSASSGPSAVRPSGVHSQTNCGVRVYMTGSGSSGQDATNDAATKLSLETNTDLCITIGVQFNALSTVTGSVTTSNYDVLYLQGQNNWGSSDLNAFDAADYAVINTFLTAGRGVVIGEWLAWDACVKVGTAAWDSLASVMPASIRSGCQYGSNLKVRFYSWNRPASALVDTGVSSDFVFQPADYAGSLSFMDLKNGATGYYWATWDQNVANVPPAADPSTISAYGGVGMAGWVPAGKSGRVFQFSTTNGAPELATTNSSNSFRRLLVNALGWSGSVGGSLNPDALTASATAGSAFSSAALVPTNISGQITYSIVNGTLPAGLTLNTSTGQITGTPQYGGTSTVTIQATGSGGGSGQAVFTLTISGAQAPASTVAPTTTTAPTTTAPSTTATPTSVASVSQERSTTVGGGTIPATGKNSTLMTMMALMMIGSGVLLMQSTRRKSLRA